MFLDFEEYKEATFGRDYLFFIYGLRGLKGQRHFLSMASLLLLASVEL